MAPDRHVYRLDLHFDDLQLVALLLRHPDGSETVLNVAVGRRDPFREISWTPGTIAVVLALVSYKAAPEEGSVFRFAGKGKESPESSACFIRDKQEWLGSESKKGTPVGDFGQATRTMFGGCKPTAAKPEAAFFIYPPALPVENLRLFNNGKEFPAGALTALADYLRAEWHRSRHKGEEEDTADAKNAVRARLAETAALKPTKQPTRHRRERWLLDNLPPNGNFVGEWTRPEISALFFHYWRYPETIHPSWSVDETASSRGANATAITSPDYCNTLLAVEFARMLSGDATQNHVDRCVDWCVREAEKLKGGLVPQRYQLPDAAFEYEGSDVRQTAALATILSTRTQGHALADVYAKEFLYLGKERLNQEWADKWAEKTDPLTRLYLMGFLDTYSLYRINDANQKQIGVLHYAIALAKILREPWTNAVASNRPKMGALWTTADMVLRLFYQNWNRPRCVPDRELLACLLNRDEMPNRAYQLLALAAPGLEMSSLAPQEVLFRFECRLAAAVRSLMLQLALAMSDHRNRDTMKDMLFVSRRFHTYLEEWAVRSRVLCTPETMCNHDVTTIIYLLMSLLDIEGLRKMGGETLLAMLWRPAEG